jgi:pre-60S factor REI1
MKERHSFFIPHAERLSDAVGLIKYLGEKISVGNVCLVCNDRGKCFHAMDSVRKHMVEKGHCRIPWETEEDEAELADYYHDSDEGGDSDWEDAGEDDMAMSDDDLHEYDLRFFLCLL